MKDITIILQKGRIKLTIEADLTIKEAITLARDNGLKGSLEIRNSIQDNENVVTYQCYFINSKNKISGAVFPF